MLSYTVTIQLKWFVKTDDILKISASELEKKMLQTILQNSSGPKKNNWLQRCKTCSVAINFSYRFNKIGFLSI